MHNKVIDYPWIQELEKTVFSSLVTSFHLDFLLFEDKVGGGVDTIHNAREGVWASDYEKKRYEAREAYNSTPYHQHSNYIETGRSDKNSHKLGGLYDSYRNHVMSSDEINKRDLDHVISAKEVHNDAGRILAELNGADLANQDTNLKSTHRSINRSKGQTPIDDYLEKLPSLISDNEKKIVSIEKRLSKLPRDTPEQQHKARELEIDIIKTQEKIDELKTIDPEAMRKVDKKARQAYDQKIDVEYYTSSKFFKASAKASGIAGLKMGTRQMLGLVLAEVWFELREQVPAIFDKIKNNFSLENFIESIKNTLHGIWMRVKKRFSDFLNGFKDGVFAGIMGSLTTTIFNIFATTQKMAVKIIREAWVQIVKAIKIIVFNPENLSFVELCKSVLSILSLGAATIIGSIAYAQLVPICSFPFGSELAAFASALITGVITLGLNYLTLHSDMAKKIWAFIDSIMPHAGTVKKFQAINVELDRYLIELGRIEFNLDAIELEFFSDQLTACNSEILRGDIINREISRQNIQLPYEMGNSKSTRKWLASLVK